MLKKISFKFIVLLTTILYILLLIWALWLKFGNLTDITANYSYLHKFTYLERFTYNLNPFDLQSPSAEGYFQIFLNALVFSPFGLLFPMLFKKKNILRDVLLCLLISAFIETIQFFSCIGAFATMDLIANSLGYFIGFGIYELFYKRVPYKINLVLYLIVDVVLITVVLIGIIQTIHNADYYLALLRREI